MTTSVARRLIVMRHAKAATWAGSDHSRELASRGRRDAADVGRWLASSDLVPDVLLVSSAARAQETGTCVADGLGRALQTVVLDDLYGADEDELLATCAEHIPADSHTVLVVGHNPTIAMVAHLLQPDEDRQDLDFPTAALAVFEIESDWASLRAGEGKLVGSYTPA